MAGNITKTAAYDHVTPKELEDALVHFHGKFQQVPPIFSAIRVGGKRLYQQAHKGVSADDIEIAPREVEIIEIKILDHQLPKFDIDVECGGGTYIRSLIRDIGYKVGSVATTTYLERTQQGQFNLSDCLVESDWNAGSICSAINRSNANRLKENGD
jgi:tRNA pseudouridine55 synthase